MEQPSSLGALLREYRLGAGMTQRELARRAGLSVRALRDIEQGRVGQPRWHSVQGLAAALRLADIDHHRLLSAAGRAGRAVAARRLDIGVLGPLTVRRDAVAVEVGPARLRCLLGLLALQPGQVVAREEIVDVLWGERPPATCLSLVHTYVARLRRLLEPGRRQRAPARVVLRVRGGYLLELAADHLDVLCFDELAEGARRAAAAGDSAAACELSARALALWRGPLLSDLDGRLQQHPAAVALCQRRLAVALAHADSAIGLGRHQQAVAPLRVLVRDEPLHESLHARLMLALAASGQQATALRLFADLRERLVNELGVEPGAEVQDAHLRILRQQLPAPAPAGAAPRASEWATPAQLPAAVAAFTGRTREQAELDRLLQPGTDTTTVVISAIAGTAGVGKTALAVHWAHRVRDRFPDGQLYVNLRGYAQGPPLRPIQALAGFLHALGVAAERVPAELEQAAGLYRTLLANRRVLLLLDNARDAEQVRALLPGSPSCLVLVTSRDRLGGLVARDGARRLTLDVLTPREADALLARLLGKQQVRAEPQATAALARACGYLPLALRIAAANLTSNHHQTVAGYLAELRGGDRLAALEAGGDEQAAVRAAFDLSYNALSAHLRRLFRLLGLVPGPDVTPQAAAALADTTPQQARQLLDQLAGAHLVNQHQPGRFAFHDLLRLYAAERCHDEDSQPERQAAIGRLLSWYLHTIDTAARRLYPQVVRLPIPPMDAGPPPVRWEDDSQALAWLDAERPNLISAIQHAAVHGPRPTAWLLADAFRGYFWLRMHTVDWLTVAHAGLAAAQADSELQAEAAAQLSIADAHMRRSEYQRAIEHYGQALKLTRRIEWVDGQAATLGSLAGVYWRSGRLHQAADHLTQALTLYQRTGQLAGQANALGNLGAVLLDLGPLALAVQHLAEAVALFKKTQSRMGEGIYLGDLGEAYQLSGRLDDAVEQLTLALTLHRHTGDLSGEADTLRCLAAAHSDAGRHAQALELVHTALTIAQKTGERRFEADALNTLASVHQRLGRHQEAFDHYQQALRLGGETENLRSEAAALIGLATAHQCLGRPDQASACVRRALALTTDTGYRLLEGDALTTMAAIHLHQRQPDSAAQEAVEALVLHRQTGHRLAEARTLLLLGLALRATGQAEAALPHWREALALFTQIGTPDANQVRELLDTCSERQL
jgi:DNA-binding SARP family transcriptional activator/DNA-binding XRE family transcriptional regulator/Tfp pilus assembly protein PilF